MRSVMLMMIMMMMSEICDVDINDICARFCVDTDHVHVSGMSNGGMFIWSRVLERLSASIASVGPVCSAPLRRDILLNTEKIIVK